MKLRYGEGSIEQRGERWRAKWYGTDGRRHTRTFPSHEAAAAHLLEVSTRKRRRRYADPSGITVAEAAEDWLERGFRTWKRGTSVSYEQRMMKHVLPRFGERKVADITATEIQRWVDGLRLAPASVASVHRTFAQLLTECVRLGIIETNPATGTELPRRRRQTRIVWSADEVRRVLAWTARDVRWHAVYHLALCTGMRPGEVRAVMWEDVDLSRRVVTVRRTVVRTDGAMVVQDGTKTGDTRLLALSDDAVEALGAWREVSRSPYVASKTRRTVISDVTWRQWHEAMCAAAGVRVIGLHGIRHTVATLLLEAGVDVKVVSVMLGHASTAFTMDVYQHVDTAMQRRATDALSSLWGATPPAD